MDRLFATTRKSLKILTITAAFFASTVFAQSSPTRAVISQPGSPVTTIKSATRLVDVDVVVTDPQGRAVTGLAQTDFDVEEDRRLQTVRSFEMHSASRVPADKARAAPSLPPNTFLNLPRGTEAGVPTVVLYDALNSSFADQAYGQQQVMTFLAHRPPGSQIAIFVLATRLYLVREFSDELGTAPELQKAIQQFVDQDRWNRVNTLSWRIKATLSALSEIGRFLTDIPGRKNVIWCSSGFPEMFSVARSLPRLAAR